MTSQGPKDGVGGVVVHHVVLRQFGREPGTPDTTLLGVVDDTRGPTIDQTCEYVYPRLSPRSG